MKLALLALPLVWLATASATSRTYTIASAPRAPASGWTALHRAPQALLAKHRALTAALGYVLAGYGPLWLGGQHSVSAAGMIAVVAGLGLAAAGLWGPRRHRREPLPAA